MSDVGFGDLLYEYSGSGGARIAMFEAGFHAQSGGHDITARWEEVAFVRKSHRRLQVAVFDRDYVNMEIGLLDGRVFALAGNDQGAALAAQWLGRLTRPQLSARVMTQLQTPGGVSFAPDVRASAERGIEQLRGGNWRSLHFQQIAGYRVTQGWCLIDEDPARPRLFAQIYLGKLHNPDAFMDLLDAVAPDKDLAERPYSVPVGVFTTSAATHDPRYLSNRARVLGLAGAVGAALLVGLVIVIYFRMEAQRDAELSNKSHEIAAKYVSALEARVRDIATATPPTTNLAEACAGKTLNLKSAMIVVASADKEVAGMWPKLPAYFESSFDGFGIKSDKANYAMATQIVVRLLSGTALEPKGQSVARAFVQVYQEPDQAVVCEGITEGHWTFRIYLKDNEDQTLREGLLTSAVIGLCADDTTSPICKDAKAPDHIKFSQGPAPATSASAKAKPPAARGR